jgi:hypothetical protein
MRKQVRGAAGHFTAKISGFDIPPEALWGIHCRGKQLNKEDARSPADRIVIELSIYNLV